MNVAYGLMVVVSQQRCFWGERVCLDLSFSDPVCAEWWVQSHETWGETTAPSCENMRVSLAGHTLHHSLSYSATTLYTVGPVTHSTCSTAQMKCWRAVKTGLITVFVCVSVCVRLLSPANVHGAGYSPISELKSDCRMLNYIYMNVKLKWK